MRHRSLWAGSLVLLTAGLATAQEPSVKDLADRLDAQQKELDELRSQLGKDAGEAGADEAKKDAGGIKLGLFFIEDTEKKWKFSIGGRIMFDYRHLWERDASDFVDNFMVRRARISFKAQLYDRVTGVLQLEAGKNDNGKAKDAYIEVEAFDALKIRGGQFVWPFSDYRSQSSKYLTHLVRGMMATQHRDVGLMLHGKVADGLVGYEVGAFTGMGANVNPTNVSASDDVVTMGRIRIYPTKSEALRFSLSFLRTETDPSRWTGPSFGGTVGGETHPYPTGSGSIISYNGANTQSGPTHFVALDAKFGTESFYVMANLELQHFGHVYPAGVGRRKDLTNWSWLVDAGYIMGGKAKHGSGGFKVTPDAPFYDVKTGAMGMGAFQFSFKYEEFHLSAHQVRNGFVTGATHVRAATFSAHWYLFKEVRFSVSHTFSAWEGGTSVVNGGGHRIVDEQFTMARLAIFF